MLRIPCPHCGTRDETEFAYHGDASVHRPVGEVSEREFFEFVYLRDNPRGLHEELRQHVGGCRAFLKIRRNTQTHEILGVSWPGEAVKSKSAPSAAPTAGDGS